MYKVFVCSDVNYINNYVIYKLKLQWKIRLLISWNNNEFEFESFGSLLYPFHGPVTIPCKMFSLSIYSGFRCSINTILACVSILII